MHPNATRFFSYMQRFFNWAQIKPAAEARADAGNGYGEPDVVETKTGVELRVYAFIESHLVCEMWGLPGSVAVSEVGFARALDKAKASGKHITVRINSYGGDVFSGTTIANLIRENKLPVTVDGVAASIASVMAAAAPVVRMLTGSTFMLHNPWTYAAGNAKTLRAEATVLDKLREAMLDIYTAKTGDKYSREQWAATLDGVDGADGSWWTGAEALAAGLADIYQLGAPAADKAAAMLDARRIAAEVHGVSLPKNLGGEGLAAPAPESLEPAGPLPARETSKAGVRVGHRPGAFRYPQ